MASDTTKTIKKAEKTGAAKKNNSAKPKKTPKKKGGFFSSILRYFKDVGSELKRVTWPTRKELVSATGAVIVFVLIMTLIVGGLDQIFYRAMFRPLTSIGASETDLTPIVQPTLSTPSGASVIGADEGQSAVSSASENGEANMLSDPQVEPEIVTGAGATTNETGTGADAQ